MAKRPYVAIWIEDADRRPVRTIALLFQKSRYLSEVRAWHRGDRQRATLEGTEIMGWALSFFASLSRLRPTLAGW